MKRQSRGVVAKATDRQLDILAAWWMSKGNYERTAMLTGIGYQPVKNALYLFRKVEGAESNLDLVMRYLEDVERINKRRHGKAARARRKAA